MNNVNASKEKMQYSLLSFIILLISFSFSLFFFFFFFTVEYGQGAVLVVCAAYPLTERPELALALATERGGGKVYVAPELWSTFQTLRAIGAPGYDAATFERFTQQPTEASVHLLHHRALASSNALKSFLDGIDNYAKPTAIKFTMCMQTSAFYRTKKRMIGKFGNAALVHTSFSDHSNKAQLRALAGLLQYHGFTRSNMYFLETYGAAREDALRAVFDAATLWVPGA